MAIDSAAEINQQSIQPQKKDGPLQSLLKFVGMHPKENLTTPAAPVSTADQIAAHQANIQASENNIKMMSGMDPRPNDRPLIDAEQAKIDAARQAISNLQTPPPAPETPVNPIPQIPVAQTTVEHPTQIPTTQPAEEQKAA